MGRQARAQRACLPRAQCWWAPWTVRSGLDDHARAARPVPGPAQSSRSQPPTHVPPRASPAGLGLGYSAAWGGGLTCVASLIGKHGCLLWLFCKVVPHGWQTELLGWLFSLPAQPSWKTGPLATASFFFSLSFRLPVELGPYTGPLGHAAWCNCCLPVPLNVWLGSTIGLRGCLRASAFSLVGLRAVSLVVWHTPLAWLELRSVCVVVGHARLAWLDRRLTYMTVGHPCPARSGSRSA